MDVDGFEVTKVFYDDANFPRGFNKSGEFTIIEAEVLHQYGHAMKALGNGERDPVSDAEKRFVSVCRGERAAESVLERVWLKYLNKIGNRVVVSVFGSSRPDVSEALAEVSEVDVDIIDDD